MNRGLESFSGERHWGTIRRHTAGLCPAWTNGGARPYMAWGSNHSRLLRLDCGPQTERYQFHFARGIIVSITPLVLAAKVPEHIARVRDIQFVSLAPVAGIHAALVADRAFPLLAAEIHFSVAAQCGELAFQSCDGSLLPNWPQHRTRIILHHITDEDAIGRECARQRGNDHSRDAERLRQFAGVETTGAAKSHQRELSRIVTALDGDHTYGFLHGGVDDPNSPGGELFRRKLRCIPLQPLGNQAARTLEIESEVSTQK